METTYAFLLERKVEGDSLLTANGYPLPTLASCDACDSADRRRLTSDKLANRGAANVAPPTKEHSLGDADMVWVAHPSLPVHGRASARGLQAFDPTECVPRSSFVGLNFDESTLIRSNLGGLGGRCTEASLCSELQSVTQVRA